MPLKRKGKGNKKRRRRKKAKPKKIDPKLIAYQCQIQALESKMNHLQLIYTRTKQNYRTLLEKRNSLQCLYNEAIHSKDDVLTFLKKQLLYLVETKESFQRRKDKEKAKAEIESYSMDECLSQMKESAEELGNKLAMDNILITNKIAVLEDLKSVRYKIMSGIQIMKGHLAEQMQIVPEQITKRTDRQFNIISQLRSRMEKYVENIRKETTKAYYLNRESDYKRYLKTNMDSRVTYVKYIDTVFQLYNQFHHLQETESKLYDEVNFVESFESRLKKEINRQQNRIVFLELETQKLSGKCIEIEAKSQRLRELKETVSNSRKEVQEMKDAGMKLESNIRDATEDLRKEKLKLKIQTQSCCKLIFALRTAEKTIKTGNILQDLHLDPEKDHQLESKLLTIIDSSEFDQFYKKDITKKKTLAIKSSFAPCHTNLHQSQISTRRILRNPTPSEIAQLRESERRILSELDMLKANRHYGLRKNET